MMRSDFVFLIVFALSFLAAAKSQAQTLSETQRLDFGTFAVRDNTSAVTITVSPDNTTRADSGIVIGEDGHRGEYLFTGLPPNVPFFLGIDVPNPPAEGGVVLQSSDPASVGGGPDFAITNLTIGNGGVMQSDHLGEAVMHVGGTLRTTGNGQSYIGGKYTGQYTVTIHY